VKLDVDVATASKCDVASLLYQFRSLTKRALKNKTATEKKQGALVADTKLLVLEERCKNAALN
jgi:hypothetical protein